MHKAGGYRLRSIAHIKYQKLRATSFIKKKEKKRKSLVPPATNTG
jgi:hypothetical protein